jgi:hypothetical protein
MPKYRVLLKVTPRPTTKVRSIHVEAEDEKAAKLNAYRQQAGDDEIVKIADCQPVKIWRVDGTLHKPVQYTLFIEGVDENEVAKRLRDEFVTWEDVLRYAEQSGGEVYDEDCYDDRSNHEVIERATPEEITQARNLSTDPYDY